MDLGNLRDTSVKIGKDRKWWKAAYAFPENVRCNPLAVVIMTTSNGMQPTFFGRYTQLFIISDLYRVLTEIAEVNTDICIFGSNVFIFINSVTIVQFRANSNY